MRLVLLVCAAMASAPAQGQAPACSDSRTIELVTHIFGQAIERRVAGMPQAKDVASGTLSRSSVIVQSIRTVRIDEKLDKHFCQGVLEIALSPRSIARLSTPEGQAALARSFDTRSVRIGESRATQDIRFTSRFGEDGKHFVEMGGFQGLAELAFRFTAPEVADQLSTSK